MLRAWALGHACATYYSVVLGKLAKSCAAFSFL